MKNENGRHFTGRGADSEGVLANTAAIPGITLGKQMSEVMGADVYDG